MGRARMLLVKRFDSNSGRGVLHDVRDSIPSFIQSITVLRSIIRFCCLTACNSFSLAFERTEQHMKLECGHKCQASLSSSLAAAHIDTKQHRCLHTFVPGWPSGPSGSSRCCELGSGHEGRSRVALAALLARWDVRPGAGARRCAHYREPDAKPVVELQPMVIGKVLQREGE